MSASSATHADPQMDRKRWGPRHTTIISMSLCRGMMAGAFHSSDLWFSFGSLAKCWRPFVGWHYDLARRMGLYWTNFAANGDPNGTDRDGTPLPVWDPCIGEECPAMHLCQEPGMRTDWLTETDRKAFGL